MRTVLTEDEIKRLNVKFVYLSCVYLAATWSLTLAIGPVGMVLANACNIGIVNYSLTRDLNGKDSR